MAFVLHILRNAHESNPWKHCDYYIPHTRTKELTLENSYIQFFHQHNMIITEQT